MKIFVVLGMHRSATSLIAKGLHDTGVHMGDDLMGPHPSNPHGHYEDVPLVQLNDQILNRAGGSWDKPPPWTDIEITDEVGAYLTDRINAGHEMWGMKDPRLILTWPTWEPALQTLPDVHLVFVIRNKEQVIRSLHKRDGRGNWDHLHTHYNTKLQHILEDWYRPH